MSEPTPDSTPKEGASKNGCIVFIVKLLIFIGVVYLIQSGLQYWLAPDQSDEIGQALLPFQNHYFAFSKYKFVTTEGAVGELTDDLTGAGRFAAMLLPFAILWFVIVVILSFIPALKDKFTTVFWIVTIVLTVVLFYSEFFQPRRKVTFTETSMTVDNSSWIFFNESYTIDYSKIQRFEYDFLKDSDVHSGSQLFSQIFAVIDGKRFLVCENQIPLVYVSGKPTEESVVEVEKALKAIREIVNH